MGKGSVRHSREKYRELVLRMSREQLEREAIQLQRQLSTSWKRANAANKEAAESRARLAAEKWEHSRTLLRYEQLENQGPRALAYREHQIELIREIVSPNQRPGAWSEFMSTVKKDDGA